MKVLLANKFFYLNGGSESVFFQERDYLLRKGVSIIDFSMEDKRNFSSNQTEYFVNNIDYQNTRGLGRKLKQAARFVHSAEAVQKLECLITKEQPDIAHLHNIYHQLTPSIINVLKKHGIKILLTLHDYKLICPSYLMQKHGDVCDACDGRHFWKPVLLHCQGSYMQEFLLMVEAFWHKWQKSYENVDLFIAPSRFMAEQISHRIPKDKIKVLQNGIDTKKFKPEFKDDGFALYFGRLSKEKGVETMLKAHNKIRDIVDLKVLGTGPDDDYLRLNYPAAEYLGYKTGDNLYRIINKAGFVIVPSECNENCSMAVLEAMAFGKPIIGSRVGGIPEQVIDGKTGFLFKMGNIDDLEEKMTTLVKDRKMRLSFGRTGRSRLEKLYSLENHCSDLLNIYNQLL